MDIDKIIAVEVDHCPQSYACLLYSNEGLGEGKKIMFSGDTTPCQNLINYSRNCTLLIHEATLGKGMELEAAKKKHTTSTQLFDLVREIKPWRTCATHFSPRYQKIMEVQAENNELKIMIAFDHMRLKLEDFEWAHHFVDIFAANLTNDRAKEEEEVKTGEPKQKRQKK